MIFLAEQVQQAGPPLLWLFLGALAVGAAGVLLAKTAKQKRQFDDRPPRLVTPGDTMNYVIGRRIVSTQPVVVFNRISRQESVGGGGKKGGFFGGPSQKTTVYYEAGVHVVGLGPATALWQILEGEEVVFQGPVTPADTPSGSALQDTNGNTFYIYWGEENQPVNTALGVEQALGVESRWPFICYLYYPEKRLGGSATWPQTDVEIECKCTAAFPLPDSECDVGGDQNGAHIIYQSMTGAYPHGVGMATGYDGETLKALGVLYESEGIGQSVAITDDTSAAAVIADILVDTSVYLVEEHGLLAFMPLRTGDDSIDAGENVVKEPLPTFEIRHGSYEDDRIVFQYPDRELNYREGDVVVSDDSTARAFNRKKSRVVPMPTVTSLSAASTLADQRKQLLMADANQVRFNVARSLRRLVPGHVLNFAGIGRLRISGVKRSLEGGAAEVAASRDQFTLIQSGWSPDTPPPTPSGGSRTPDTLVRVWEAPRRFAGQRVGLWVLRGREDGSGSEAAIYTSTDGISYVLTGYQNYVCAMGILTEDLVREPSGYQQYRLVETSGPTIEFNAINASRLLDLSGSDNDWRVDRQVMLIDEEILAVRRFTNEGGGQYRAEDVVREQVYTQRGQHFVDEALSVLVFEPENLSVSGRTDWVPGQTIYVKVVPEGVSIAEIEAIEMTITGRAIGALPIDNLGPDTWFIGTIIDPLTPIDIEFTWTNRINVGTGTGSGELPAGTAVPAYPGPEGDHIVRLYRPDGVFVGEYTADTPTSWTFTALEQIALEWDQYPDAFYLEVVNRLNGIEGYPVRKRINYTELLNTP